VAPAEKDTSQTRGTRKEKRPRPGRKLRAWGTNVRESRALVTLAEAANYQVVAVGAVQTKYIDNGRPFCRIDDLPDSQ
jgi:hypothetical protein